MNLKNLIKRHPLFYYFILVYLLAWGGILLIARVVAESAELDPTVLVGIVSLPMLFAPGIAAIALTALTEGRTGLRTLLQRMTHWRVPFRWYVVALFPMPLVILAILYALALLFSPNFLPIFSILGLAGIFAGFFEEIGWTGFATRRLLSRWQPLLAGLVIGLLWGLWHGLADYLIRGATLGAFWPITFSLFVLPLTAWRILMVWVYHQSKSGPVAQLMHFSYTGSLALFVPLAAISYKEDALIYALLAGVLWLSVAILAIRWQQTTQKLRAQPGKSYQQGAPQ